MMVAQTSPVDRMASLAADDFSESLAALAAERFSLHRYMFLTIFAVSCPPIGRLGPTVSGSTSHAFNFLWGVFLWGGVLVLPRMKRTVILSELE